MIRKTKRGLQPTQLAFLMELVYFSLCLHHIILGIIVVVCMLDDAPPSTCGVHLLPLKFGTKLHRKVKPAEITGASMHDLKVYTIS